MGYELCEKIINLSPYEPCAGEYAVRLDANESFLDLPNEVRERIIVRISEEKLNRYPDSLSAETCARFAEYYGISPEYVTAGNGSDELLSIITQAFLMRGETMTVLSDDFSMYGFYGSVAEAKVDTYKKTPDGIIDPRELIARVNESGSRLLIFSNPCNPTGLFLDADSVMSIVDGCPNCLVVIDEAYMDFCGRSVIKNVITRDNMMVLRTCSKALRIAAVRCGFAVAGKAVTNALRAVKSPYNVNRITQIIAAETLAAKSAIDSAVQSVVENREKLGEKLFALRDETGAFSMNRSEANFFYLKFDGDKARDAFEKLKKRGIIVRCFSSALRITVGSSEENEIAFKALSDILKGGNGVK